MRILYRPVWDGVMASLRDIFVQGWQADKVIQRQIKAHRKWGSHDRKLYAESVYDMVRWWRKLLFAAEIPWPLEDRWTSGDLNTLSRVIEVWCCVHDVKMDTQISSVEIDGPRALRLWREAKMPRPVRESIPNWLDRYGEQQIGERWETVLRSLNQSAPVFLRANRLKTTPAQLLADLRKDKVEAKIIEADCVQLAERANVYLAKSFALGHFEVQDRHSQRVAAALGPQPGERIIDACAGAGGKTLHVAALMHNKGKIIALDVAEKKLEQLRERATRDGATSIEVRPIAGSKTIKRLKASADRLLLDVPCSGIGVLRRNPDSKWKLNLDELKNLTRLQSEILANYAEMCKPGGVMVYATCSLFPTENEHQIKTFLSQNGATWKLEHQETLWPEEFGGDGFFIARMMRS